MNACARSRLRLRRVFRDAVLVARIGGDEFAVLLRVTPRTGPIAQDAGTRLGRLCEPIVWNDTRLAIGASIGATILGPARNTAVFAEADAALYAAKTEGRNAVRIHGVEVRPPSAADHRERGSRQAAYRVAPRRILRPAFDRQPRGP